MEIVGRCAFPNNLLDSHIYLFQLLRGDFFQFDFYIENPMGIEKTKLSMVKANKENRVKK